MRFCPAVVFAGFCCLHAQSLELTWSLPLGRAASGPPVAYAGGMAVTLNDGRIVFVDDAGKLTATARMDQAPMGPALVAGGAVYAADAWGSVYKFTTTGERVWKYARESRAGSGYNTPVLAMGGVVITDTRGLLYLVDANGRLRMEVQATSYRLSTPSIGDFDGDGNADVVFGADNGTVYCVSSDGRLLWEKHLPGTRLGRALPVVADIDDDGRYDVLMPTPFVGRQTGMHALDKWHFKSEMQTYASTMLVDLNGDGEKEILFGDKNTRLYALNARGEKLWSTQLGGRGIFYAGVAAGDWIYQIVRDTGLDGKSLYVLDKKGNVRKAMAMDGGGSYSPAVVRGRLLAVSNKGTLHSYRIDAGPPHWSSWRNSADSSGFFESAKARRISIDRNPSRPGKQWTAQHGTNTLPPPTPRTLFVERPDGSTYFAINSGSFPAIEPGDYMVHVNGANPVRYSLGAEPFPLRLPRGEFFDAVRARFRAEYEFAQQHPSIERFDALREKIREANELLGPQSIPPAADVMIRQLESPWSKERAFREGLRVKMLGNEFESIAFTVTNLRPSTAQVRVVCDAKFVDIREVPLVRPESTGRLTEDVLPRLNEAGIITLAAGESRKLWAIVNSRSLAAGNHTATVRAGDTLSLAKPLEVPLHIAVSKARLPERRTYQQCHWLYLASIADPAAREATIVDALDHGMTVFPIPPIHFPLEGKPDSALHDSLVTRLKGKATFLVTGSVGGPLAAKDYSAAIRKYSEHMLELGLDFKDWAFYYMDEPGLMGKDAAFDKYVQDITRVKEADPRVRIYANPAGGAKPEMLAPLTNLIDIWQPDLHLVREHPEAYKKIFEQGTYWHYEAGADQRNLDSLGYYRMKPWVAFQMGMTGGGYWVYSYSPFWFFDQSMGTEYGTVYQTANGPVTTKRWEASRDGAEDFELLWQVREKARSRKDAAALRLLNEAVAFVTAGQENVSDISRQVEPFAPDYQRWMRYREELIAAWERML